MPGRAEYCRPVILDGSTVGPGPPRHDSDYVGHPHRYHICGRYAHYAHNRLVLSKEEKTS